MTAATCLGVMLAAITAAGCSQVLGFKEPRADDETPEPDAPADTPSVCMPQACQFGCDPGTNECRAGKLWIFKTSASFLGKGFGGTDTPPNVRGGADGQCLASYTALYSARQCNTNRVHAILHVNSTDSLSLMATRYTIPTNVPVHRAEDDVLVSDNWNDLTSSTIGLRAPATTAATDADGLVWTGTNTVATCANWTSALSTDSGTRGYTNRTNATWLSQDTFRCDRLFSLLCICWPGGE
ncbi:MAG TPA: hypothetical protein VN253_26075 [Kofleriaceae bacterium]|nr:hypothetical protein [Kofleriaceae bacterium]